jgi:hypothetical protein
LSSSSCLADSSRRAKEIGPKVVHPAAALSVIEMITTFGTYYRQLGRATIALLITSLAFFGLTLFCAILGFSHAAASLRGAALSVSSIFIVLLTLFLISSLVAAFTRWLDRSHRVDRVG